MISLAKLIDAILSILVTNQFSNMMYTDVWNSTPLNNLLVINIDVLMVTN